MYTTGEKPGKGRYKCVKYGEIISLYDNSDTLPPYPRCSGTKWTKVD